MQARQLAVSSQKFLENWRQRLLCLSPKLNMLLFCNQSESSFWCMGFHRKPDLHQNWASPSILPSFDLPSLKTTMVLLPSLLPPRLPHKPSMLLQKHNFFNSKIGPSSGATVKPTSTSEDQKADIFAKGLSPEKFKHVCQLLIGW